MRKQLVVSIPGYMQFIPTRGKEVHCPDSKQFVYLKSCRHAVL